MEHAVSQMGLPGNAATLSASQAHSKNPACCALVARNELLFTAGALATLAGLLLPASGKALDILLVFGICLTAALVAIALSAKKPTELAGFPLLLILTMLMHLAINAAVSRAVLLQTGTGTIITGLGTLLAPLVSPTGLAETNALWRPVGIAVFLVMAIVVFGLICKAAKGVRRTALTFTAEVLPLKKLGIETDFNAGLIDNQQAHQLREKINCQGRFFTAMTGAASLFYFNAVIMLIIILVNVTAGLALACTNLPMAGTTAMKTYSALAVGELIRTAVGAALIAQLPAFLLATASKALLNKQFFMVGRDKSDPAEQAAKSHKRVSNKKSSFHNVLRRRCLAQDRSASEMPPENATQPNNRRACRQHENAPVERTADFEPVGSQKSEDRCQKSEVGSQKSEVRRTGRDELYDTLTKQIEQLPFEKARTILFAAPTRRGRAQLGVTTVVNVAMRLAQKGQRALLVDTDAGRNAAAKVFDIAGALKAPVKTCIENLWLWPAENFARHDVTTLPGKFDRLRKKFHRIIIYAPNSEHNSLYENLAKTCHIAFLFDSDNQNEALDWLHKHLNTAGSRIIKPD